MRTTYTYVILDLSTDAYEEIAAKLKAAGYEHAFHKDDGRIVIDMHGIAVAEDSATPRRCRHPRAAARVAGKEERY